MVSSKGNPAHNQPCSFVISLYYRIKKTFEHHIDYSNIICLICVHLQLNHSMRTGVACLPFWTWCTKRCFRTVPCSSPHAWWEPCLGISCKLEKKTNCWTRSITLEDEEVLTNWVVPTYIYICISIFHFTISWKFAHLQTCSVAAAFVFLFSVTALCRFWTSVSLIHFFTCRFLISNPHFSAKVWSTGTQNPPWDLCYGCWLGLPLPPNSHVLHLCITLQCWRVRI